MNKGTVLFIDDDSFLRKVYQAELHDKGFEVALAVDGEDGMQKIMSLKPDCVILDLIMPKKNGFEVLTDMQHSDELKRIPVIVLSNLAQSDDQRKALDLGAVEYLVKDNTTLDVIAERINYHILTNASKPHAASPAVKEVSSASAPSPVASVAEPAGPPAEPSTVAPAKAKGRGHNFCPECGVKLEKNDKFCSQCGTQQY